VLRILLAGIAGKASGLDTLSPAFRSQDDTRDRIVAITDAFGNRTTVSVDGA
jgi:hypothetical protein